VQVRASIWGRSRGVSATPRYQMPAAVTALVAKSCCVGAIFIASGRDHRRRRVKPVVIHLMKTETIVMGNRDYPLVALRHRLSCWTSSFKQGTSAYRRHIAPGWVLRRMKISPRAGSSC
jgi:hypothetical protein